MEHTCEPTATIDYRAENERLKMDYAALSVENDNLRHVVNALERDNATMSAQLDIVRLIFGGDR